MIFLKNGIEIKREIICKKNLFFSKKDFTFVRMRVHYCHDACESVGCFEISLVALLSVAFNVDQVFA